MIKHSFIPSNFPGTHLCAMISLGRVLNNDNYIIGYPNFLSTNVTMNSSMFFISFQLCLYHTSVNSEGKSEISYINYQYLNL